MGTVARGHPAETHSFRQSLAFPLFKVDKCQLGDTASSCQLRVCLSPSLVVSSLSGKTDISERLTRITIMEDFGHWNCEDEVSEWEILNSHSDLAVPGHSTREKLDGLDRSGSENKFSVSDFKGKFLVVVFHKSDVDSKLFLEAFSDLSDLFRGNKTEVVACSKDKLQVHSYWRKSSDGFAGQCKISLWSDPEGKFASRFDMWDTAGGFCREGVVIIDESGLVRHAMTSSMEPMDMAKYILEMVITLKKEKVNEKDLNEAGKPTKASSSSSSTSRAISPVKINRDDLEAEWDVSQDPELLKVLNKARMLGRAKPTKTQVQTKTPVFDMSPDKIRKLQNPKRSIPVRWCSASLHRNLAGFGTSGNISKDNRVKLETLIKKVMGVAYMPEDLTGKYTRMASLNQREQIKLLESDIFVMTGDSWMKEPGSVEWSEGKGVFVNNYSNFVLWVGLDDQLRFTSVAKGTDLKYVLLRLQKAMARIEEALKSCNERSFATSKGAFIHNKRGVYHTGFETTFTIDLPGFAKAEKMELEKARNDLFLDIEKGRSGTIHTVVLKQSPDDSELDIVTRSVEAVDTLWERDIQLQAKLGIKIDQTGRSL